MILLTKLLLAYLLGEFVVQPASWIRVKEKLKHRSPQLFLYGLVHGSLITILAWNWDFMIWALILTIFHIAIEYLKLILQKPKTKSTYFFLSQLAHLLSIYFVFCWHEGYNQINTSYFNETNFYLITAIIFLLTPSAVAIKEITTKWSKQIKGTEVGKLDQQESLQNAGKFIGMLERLFVFVFIISNNWEAVGFLLAAKSVFRFGDLKESKDIKLTEYILIGTLLSFGIAILTGITFVYLTSYLVIK